MKIASWNVNSIRARLGHVIDFLRQEKPDLLLLQELKAESFPEEELADFGYNIAAFGQKSWNGVAILSRRPFDTVRRGLSGAGEEDARYIEAAIPHGKGMLHVASFYLPNGNPVDSPKFEAKIAWMESFAARIAQLRAIEEPFLLGGDTNVLDLALDCEDIDAWKDDALGHPRVRSHYRRMVFSGLCDAVRVFHPGPGVYSYWGYRGGAWDKNNGLLIDRFLLDPQAADRLTGAGIVKAMRGREKASDHAPIWCTLRDA